MPKEIDVVVSRSVLRNLGRCAGCTGWRRCRTRRSRAGWRLGHARTNNAIRTTNRQHRSSANGKHYRSADRHCGIGNSRQPKHARKFGAAFDHESERHYSWNNTEHQSDHPGFAFEPRHVAKWWNEQPWVNESGYVQSGLQPENVESGIEPWHDESRLKSWDEQPREHFAERPWLLSMPEDL